MPTNTTTSTTGGGTVTSFSNAPQASGDLFNLTEDTAVVVGSTGACTIISLDVMANDSGGAAKSLYSIDDGESASTATKTYAPIDLTKVETWVGGVSAWEPSGTPGIMIRLNSLTGKVEMDLTQYLADHGWSSLDAMNAGDSINESFTYAIRLGNGTLSWAKADIHIVGSNDAAVISGTDTAELTESDLAQETGGKLDVADVDNDDSFVPQSGVAGNNGYGTFEIDAAGNWTYVMNSPHDEFEEGVDYTDSFTVEAADGTTTVVTVTIHGTNDAPELTGTQAELEEGTEEQLYTISEADLLAGFSDPEGDPLSISDLSAEHGSLHDNGDGTWTFTPDENFNGTVTLTYNVDDDKGGSTPATQTFGIANVEDEAAGTLGVTGTAEEGGSLVAALTDVSDADGTTTTSYQWQVLNGAMWEDIAGEDGATFDIDDDQTFVGKDVRVVATTTDTFGGTTVFEGDAMTVANVDDEATGTLDVTGTAEEGGSLSAALTDVTDEDGTTTTAYQWQVKDGDDWVDIAGEDGATFNIADDQTFVGTDMRVVATTTDALSGTTVFEGDAQTVANVEDEATGTLDVTGTAEEGGSLTAALSDVTDEDGTTTTAYQWQVKDGDDWVDIAGEDEATFNIAADQTFVGKEVRVVATTTDALSGTTEFEGEARTVANVDDAAVGTLGIGGDHEEGGTLTADTSGLTDEDDGIVSVAYQWQLDGVDIEDATTDTLSVPGDQTYVGHVVTLKVTTTDAFGGTTDFTADADIANVNDDPTDITLSSATLAENAVGATVGTLAASDPDPGAAHTFTVDDARFEVVGNELKLKAGQSLDYEAEQSVSVEVTADDGLGGTYSESFTITVTDVNEAPSVSLVNELAATPENGAAIKVADIVVTDDALGTNGLSLSGADADSFDIVGNELWFDGGADFETKASYDVTVNVNDAGVGADPDDTAGLTLAISDVVETVPASLPATSTDTGDTNDFDSSGAAGPQSINDGSSNTTRYGGAGNDSIVGGNGSDLLYGGSGNDTLTGDNGGDTLFGGSGDDSITGGLAGDTIVGGFGADAISPGTGDGSGDTLRYLDLRDTNDSIFGFVSGTDKIDLSAIDSGDADHIFNWGGQEAGPVVEANSVTWYTASGNVVVLADTDGNLNTAEFSITLIGITSVTSADFTL